MMYLPFREKKCNFLFAAAAAAAAPPNPINPFLLIIAPVTAGLTTSFGSALLCFVCLFLYFYLPFF